MVINIIEEITNVVTLIIRDRDKARIENVMTRPIAALLDTLSEGRGLLGLSFLSIL
jgi:hypothetical protein